MSGQGSQRVRRNVSPGSTKQGPMRATLPVSLMRQSSSPTKNGNKKSSPSNSPTASWVSDSHKMKSRRSPDNRSSPERHSPGSPNFKAEKSKVKSSSNSVIRRTASLDTVYLAGQWPRDLLATYCGRLMFDKGTQTPEEWETEEQRKSHKRSASVGNGDQLKELIRQRLQRTKDNSRQNQSSNPRHSPVHGDHSAISSNPSNTMTTTITTTNTTTRMIPIPVSNIPKPGVLRIRGSIEGLNQEIERLVLKGISGTNGEELDRAREPTPDGHRAPIADLIRSSSTRDVDTQTPSSAFEDSGNSSGSASRCQSISPAFIPGQMDSSRPSSQSDSIDSSWSTDASKTSDSKSASVIDASVLGSSLKPNAKFAREPPDGCERVKIIEESRNLLNADPLLYCPIRPNVNFVLKPSQGSAFCPLYKSYIPQMSSELAVRSPASTISNQSGIESQ